MDEVLTVCGKTALNLLLLTLCITPIRRSTGSIGSSRFGACSGCSRSSTWLHFLVYLFLDRGMEWGTIIDDVAEQPYITVGFAALLMKYPLAATSTNALQRQAPGAIGRGSTARAADPRCSASCTLVAGEARRGGAAAVRRLVDRVARVRVHHWREIDEAPPRVSRRENLHGADVSTRRATIARDEACPERDDQRRGHPRERKLQR